MTHFARSSRAWAPQSQASPVWEFKCQRRLPQRGSAKRAIDPLLAAGVGLATGATDAGVRDVYNRCHRAWASSHRLLEQLLVLAVVLCGDLLHASIRAYNHLNH